MPVFKSTKISLHQIDENTPPFTHHNLFLDGLHIEKSPKFERKRGGGRQPSRAAPAGDLLAKKGADLKIVHDPLKGPVVKGPGPRRARSLTRSFKKSSQIFYKPGRFCGATILFHLNPLFSVTQPLVRVFFGGEWFVWFLYECQSESPNSILKRFFCHIL